MFWRLMHFYTHLLLLLQPSVQWLSIVNFNKDAKPPSHWILREFDVPRIRPRPGGSPHLEKFTWQNLTPAERVTLSSVQWLSIVNFNKDAKPPSHWILREFDVPRIRPRPGGSPHLEKFTWQNLTPAERVTLSGRPGYPPWWVTPSIM